MIRTFLRSRRRELIAQLAVLSAELNGNAVELAVERARWVEHAARCTFPAHPCCSHCPDACSVKDRHVGACEAGCDTPFPAQSPGQEATEIHTDSPNTTGVSA